MTAPLWTQVYYQTVRDCPFVDTGLLSDTDSDCPFVDTGLLSVSDCPFVDTGLSDTDSDCRGLLLHTGRLTAEVCYYTQADGQLTKQSLSIGIRKMTRHFSCFVRQRVGWQNLYKLTHGIASL